MSSSNAIKMPFLQQYTEKRPSQVFTPSGILSHQESTNQSDPHPHLSLFSHMIFSTFSSLQAALSDLKKTLPLNGYPKGIISFNMNDVLNKYRNRPSETVTTVPKSDVILVLPYLGFRSEVFKRRLKSCVNKFFGFVNVSRVDFSEHLPR